MSTKQNIDDKLVFAVIPEGTGDGAPIMIVGVPAAAWDHMKAGKTHTVDLTIIGLPIKLSLFGCADHAAGMAVLEQAAKNAGAAYVDMRRADFSIKEPGG